ncbi:CDP-diacylglycerol--glycerol-3-phosphate 3-phosphatidyltransferase, partial [Dysosmobacter welbionis]
GAAAGGIPGGPGGQRCGRRHPGDGGPAEAAADRDLRCLRRLPAGDGNVLLGRQGAAGRSEKGAGPRHGRSAVLRHGSGGGRAEWLCGHLGGETGLRDRGKEWTGGLEVEVVSETDGAGGSVGPAAGGG